MALVSLSEAERVFVIHGIQVGSIFQQLVRWLLGNVCCFHEFQLLVLSTH